MIDEEQRFGVKQKERLKMICGGIDVLTLSATPIPRTLQMSLSGIRDTSTIRSAPPMRLPIKTEVREFDLDVLKKAVENELERGGQCFFVVPRIAMLSVRPLTQRVVNEGGGERGEKSLSRPFGASFSFTPMPPLFAHVRG